MINIIAIKLSNAHYIDHSLDLQEIIAAGIIDKKLFTTLKPGTNIKFNVKNSNLFKSLKNRESATNFHSRFVCRGMYTFNAQSWHLLGLTPHRDLIDNPQ
jgi:hypothetical protein